MNELSTTLLTCALCAYVAGMVGALVFQRAERLANGIGFGLAAVGGTLVTQLNTLDDGAGNLSLFGALSLGNEFAGVGLGAGISMSYTDTNPANAYSIVWPPTQGAAGTVLTNSDGAGTLTFAL